MQPKDFLGGLKPAGMVTVDRELAPCFYPAGIAVVSAFLGSEPRIQSHMTNPVTNSSESRVCVE